jgi:hypothetical protein
MTVPNPQARCSCLQKLPDLGFVSSARFPEQQNRVGRHSDVSIFKFKNLFANAMEVDESGAKVFIQHVHLQLFFQNLEIWTDKNV